MSESTANNYKDTLNLPKTAFEMKANLTQREPAMLAGWKAEGLYGKIRAARKGAAKGKWVLHDGPPYANGDIHMGHLINKVLKDIVVKFRTMEGFDSPYVPGWDCHGLPIESAIQKELGPKFRELSKGELRKKCAEYALKYVKLQGESFQRLGILGEFERPYLTLNREYEGGILDVLAELVKGDLVYRQKKPVHWCVNDRTALAEAELEYANKRDTSIYVKFDLVEARQFFPVQWNALLSDCYGQSGQIPHRFSLLIWTTTPWTLPANRAVAINPDNEYVLVTFSGKGNRHLAGGKTQECVVMAKELVERVMKTDGTGRTLATGWLSEPNELAYFVSAPVRGADWVAQNPKYTHPLDPARIQPVVLADYVTLEDGTGLVHTAPGHGKEDYQTGMKYGLDVYNPVLADGRYDETVPEFLRGKLIWEANGLVVEKLKELGTLFHAQEFEHEYPHCWRCKKPVIFRATEQWFVDVDRTFLTKEDPQGLPPSSIRNRSMLHDGDWQSRAVEAKPKSSGQDKHTDLSTDKATSASFNHAAALAVFEFVKMRVVKCIPEWGQNRLNGMLLTRPDWCISRQRSWGVPIPAFFDGRGRCLLTEASVRRVAEYFRAHGADSWYADSAAEILGLGEGVGGAVPTSPEATGVGGVAVGLRALGFPEDVELASLEKGMDILDVWFESGASHHAVLECTHPELGYPAKMYLEGSDQHRGWFQSSLLEASGYKDKPPFEEVLTHGFVVDEKGRKMSKSEGNDIKVDAALKQYGADVLRLWVCSVDYQNDIPCGPNLLAKTGEAYRKVRNTIRYLLGNLYDFNPAEHMLGSGATTINTWMLNRSDQVFSDCHKAYDNYEFHRVFKNLYEFCNVEISSIYAKAIKDRLYCELPNSPKRRAAQSVCYWVLIRLVELLAPVLVFTAEEAWSAIRQLPGLDKFESSVHLATFLSPLRSSDDASARHWKILMPLIEKGNKQLDELKKSVGLGNALDAEAVIVVPSVQDEVSAHIAEYGPEIEDALGVGFHRIEHGEMWDIKINDTREKYPSCARSWKRRPDVGNDSMYPDLSKRDAEVVRALRG